MATSERSDATMNTMPANAEKVIVVGAGICGLTAAYRLQLAGFEVEVLEREPRVSGRVKSVQLGGVTIDTGATVFLPAYRQTLALIDELGLQHDLEPIRGQIAFVRDGQLHLLDTGAPLKALFTRVIGWRSKLSLLKLLWRFLSVRKKLNFLSLAPARGHDDETLEAYCRERFPAEVYTYVLNPALKFLYLHNGRSGSLIELLWWLAATGLGTPRSLRRGSSSLTDALAAKLKVHTSTEALDVSQQGDGVVVRARLADGSEQLLHADRCIVTTPGTISARICRDGLSLQQREFLRSRRYDPCTVVSFVTRQRPALDALMFMVSDELNSDLATVIFAHNIGASRTTDGSGIVNTYFMKDWSVQHARCSDDTVLEAARAVLSRWIPEVSNTITSHVERWQYSAAVSEVGDCARIAKFEAGVDPASPIQVIGDFTAQASMNVAVACAEQAARRLINRRDPRVDG